jgi:hypothetical protein
VPILTLPVVMGSSVDYNSDTGCGCSSVVQPLPSMCEALVSNLSPRKKSHMNLNVYLNLKNPTPPSRK